MRLIVLIGIVLNGCVTPTVAQPIHLVSDQIYETSVCLSPEQFQAARSYNINTFVAVGHHDEQEEREARMSGFSYFYADNLKEALAGMTSRAKPVLLRCDQCGKVLVAYYRIRSRGWPTWATLKHLSASDLAELHSLLKN